MPKELLDDDQGAATVFPKSLTINRKYADKYDAVKRKMELEKLQAKYSDADSSDESEPEDEHAVLLTPAREDEFARLMLAIRRDSAELHDPAHRFFSDVTETEDRPSNAAQFTLKDEYQRALNRVVLTDDDDQAPKKSSTAGPQEVKQNFLKAVGESLPGFHVVKTAKSDTMPLKVDRTKSAQAKKRLREALSPAVDDGEDESFLKDFFLNERWRMVSAHEPVLSAEQVEADEQDAEFFDEAERWEKEFVSNRYRHQEGIEALEIKTYPRSADGSVRQKNQSRKHAREQAAARKIQQEDRATLELRRLKTLKRLEIEDRLKAIARVAGMKNVPPATLDALEKDFDPQEFDQIVNAMLGEHYDDAKDDEIEAEMNSADEEHKSVAEMPAGESFKFLYPTREVEETFEATDKSLESSPSFALHQSRQDVARAVDEYYKLHYDKVIGGDLRTRFKYRTVNAEHFGLSDADVLVEDDRTLNMIAPINCYAAYLSASDNKRDRFKSIHRSRNLRTLPPERRSRRYSTDTVVFNVDDPQGPCIARRISKAAKILSGNEDGQLRKRAHLDGGK